MPEQLISCRFVPGDAVAQVAPGTTVLEAARQIGYPLVAACQGRKSCGTCAIRVIEGALASPSEDEASILGAARGVRLGCRACVEGPVTVEPIIKSPALTDYHNVAGRHHPDTTPAEVSLALDLGTTTLKGQSFFTLPSSRVPQGSLTINAPCTLPNPLAPWGSDIMSRLGAAADSHVAYQMQELLQDAVARLIEQCLESTSETIATRILIAGNTVMSGLFAGDSLDCLRAAPFACPQATRLQPSNIVSNSLSALFKPGFSREDITILEPLGSFVGGDARAALIASGLAEQDRVSLLIDIGTNVETLLVTPEAVWGASAPAGSAFLMAGQEGTDLLELALKLREEQALSKEGLLDEASPLIERCEGILTVIENGLTQVQLRDAQLAKAAVRVTVDGLLSAAGVGAGEVEKLMITGVFGRKAGSILEQTRVIPHFTSAAVDYLPDAVLAGLRGVALGTNSVFDRRYQAVDLVHAPQFQENLMSALDW